MSGNLQASHPMRYIIHHSSQNCKYFLKICRNIFYKFHFLCNFLVSNVIFIIKLKVSIDFPPPGSPSNETPDFFPKVPCNTIDFVL